LTENQVKERGKTLTHYTVMELTKSLRTARFSNDCDEVRCIKHALYLKRNGLVDGELKYK
jgi:hypothetical protein